MNASRTKPSKTTVVKPANAKAKRQPDAAPESAAYLEPPAGEGQLVRLHELNGFALLFLPPSLRQILGEAPYRDCEQNIRQFQATLHIREGDCLIEVALPVRVAPFDADGWPDLASEVGSAPTSSKTEKPDQTTGRSTSLKGAP